MDMKNQRLGRLAVLIIVFLASGLWAADEKKYRIVVLDKKQRSVIPGAVLRVYDQNKNQMVVSMLPGEYVVALPDQGNFTFDASASGYLPVRGARLERPASGVIQILLTRRPGSDNTQTVAFVAKDALTKQPLSARFRLTNTQTNITFTPTVTTADHPEFGTELTRQQRYLLKVSADGYEEYTASILIKEKEPEPIMPRVILLRPLDYEVSFAFRDGGSLQSVNPERMQILESGQTVPLSLEGDVGRATLRVGKEYEIRVGKEGYELFEQLLKFSMPAAPGELTKSILLVKSPERETIGSVDAGKPLPNGLVGNERDRDASKTGGSEFGRMAVGEVIRLNSVYFDQSSYNLRPESSRQLDQLVTTLKADPKLKIEIGGHTDNVGDPRLNQYLSENRAKVISSYLINRGVSERQLVWNGYGQTRPIAPNDTEENRARNRRVELIILEK
jgi:outer membrane protein OmpA-like peptidoglycan-associated protein